LDSANNEFNTAFGEFDKNFDNKVSELTSNFGATDLHASEVNEVTSSEEDKYGDIVCAFALILGCSLLDLDQAISDVIDLTGIRRVEWDSVRLTTRQPKKNRTIIELGPMCYHQTRFTEDELEKLNGLFFGSFPTDKYVFKGNVFSYEETLLIALDYMANGTKYVTMSQTYGGDWTRYSLIVNWFAKFLFHKYYHRLCGRSLQYWIHSENVDKFRTGIYNFVKYNNTDTSIPELDHIIIDYFRTMGYLDCMQLAMCQPGSGPINDDDERNPDRWEIQRAFYTAYGKMWGMKCQGTFFPNGMLGNAFFTSVSQNDKGVINISGLEEELQRLLLSHQLHDGVLPALYADDIYDVSTVIVKKNGVDDLFHIRMNAGRIDIEHEFGLTASLWKRLSVKHTWHLLKLGNRVREHLFSIFFMVNVYTCVRGNKTSTKYWLVPPTVEEYLDVDMDDMYDGDDADELMIERLQTQNQDDD